MKKNAPMIPNQLIHQSPSKCSLNDLILPGKECGCAISMMEEKEKVW